MPQEAISMSVISSVICFFHDGVEKRRVFLKKKCLTFLLVFFLPLNIFLPICYFCSPVLRKLATSCPTPLQNEAATWKKVKITRFWLGSLERGKGKDSEPEVSRFSIIVLFNELEKVQLAHHLPFRKLVKPV